MNTTDDVGDFFCVDAASGAVSRPGKRRRVVGSVTASDIRVTSALANLDRVLDCRGLSLYEICRHTCLRQVNSINWSFVPPLLASDILSTAHQAGSLSDKTVKSLINGPHTTFLTTLNLSNTTLREPRGLLQLADRLSVLDLTGAVRNARLAESMVKVVVKLELLEWLSLEDTSLSSSHLQVLAYPSLYLKKGLTRLRYLDISDNPEIDSDRERCLRLVKGFPKLEIVILDNSQQRYYPFPEQGLSNWGHDVVLKMIGCEPKVSATGGFYVGTSEAAKSCKRPQNYLPYPTGLPILNPPPQLRHSSDKKMPLRVATSQRVMKKKYQLKCTANKVEKTQIDSIGDLYSSVSSNENCPPVKSVIDGLDNELLNFYS